MSKVASKLSQRLATKQPMDLEDFLLKKRVLKLYRDVLRISQHLQPTERREVREWFRGDIERNRQITDKDQIKHLLTIGNQSLRTLQASVVLIVKDPKAKTS